MRRGRRVPARPPRPAPAPATPRERGGRAARHEHRGRRSRRLERGGAGGGRRFRRGPRDGAFAVRARVRLDERGAAPKLEACRRVRESTGDAPYFGRERRGDAPRTNGEKVLSSRKTRGSETLDETGGGGVGAALERRAERARLGATVRRLRRGGAGARVRGPERRSIAPGTLRASAVAGGGDSRFFSDTESTGATGTNGWRDSVSRATHRSPAETSAAAAYLAGALSLLQRRECVRAASVLAQQAGPRARRRRCLPRRRASSRSTRSGASLALAEVGVQSRESVERAAVMTALRCTTAGVQRSELCARRPAAARAWHCAQTPCLSATCQACGGGAAGEPRARASALRQRKRVQRAGARARRAPIAARRSRSTRRRARSPSHPRRRRRG